MHINISTNLGEFDQLIIACKSSFDSQSLRKYISQDWVIDMIDSILKAQSHERKSVNEWPKSKETIRFNTLRDNEGISRIVEFVILTTVDNGKITKGKALVLGKKVGRIIEMGRKNISVAVLPLFADQNIEEGNCSCIHKFCLGLELSGFKMRDFKTVNSSATENKQGDISVNDSSANAAASDPALYNVSKLSAPEQPQVSVITDLKVEKMCMVRAASEGNILAKRLVTLPPNILYPDAYANMIREKLEPLGIKVSILETDQIRDLGMNCLLGVASGSMYQPRVVTMEYNAGDEIPRVAFVGKGVTFDTGGISIKPSNGMWDMKYDMAGSAAVVGAMYAIAKRGARANVVGVVGLVENMISATAQRPSDIVKSMSGKTVEVLDTDAEGRLVLADLLWYAQTHFGAKAIVDLATLTGAVSVALGNNVYGGLMSNDDELSKILIEAGTTIHERLWQLPLGIEYDKLMDSKIADMQNISQERGGAGTITAACFLQRFIQEGVKWAHIDMANMAWRKKANDCDQEGATGFGVLLLNQFIKKWQPSQV